MAQRRGLCCFCVVFLCAMACAPLIAIAFVASYILVRENEGPINWQELIGKLERSMHDDRRLHFSLFVGFYVSSLFLIKCFPFCFHDRRRRRAEVEQEEEQSSEEDHEPVMQDTEIRV